MENLRNQRQREVVKAVENAGWHASVQACVGFGKSFVVFKVLAAMLHKKVLPGGSKVVFQTSGTALTESIFEELKLFKQIYGVPIDQHLHFQAVCYQAMMDLSGVDYLINDEVDYCGPELSKNFETYTGKMLNLTGTLSKTTEVHDGVTKYDWVNSLAPVVYHYPLEQGIKEGLLVNFETILINHELTNNLYKPLFKSQRRYLTEREYYAACVKMVTKHRFPDLEKVLKAHLKAVLKEEKKLGRKLTEEEKEERYDDRLKKAEKSAKAMSFRYGRMGATMLQTLPSKINPVRQLLLRLHKEGKRTLLWGNNLDYLQKIVKPKFVVTPDNLEAIDRFNSKETWLIAFSKKLLRGCTPTEVDAMIMVNPIGSSTTFEQLLGRTVRTDSRPDKVATLYIFRTNNSYEEDWLYRGCIREPGDSIDLNIIEIW